METKKQRSIDELRKVAAEALAKPWNQQFDGEQAIRDARQERLDELEAIIAKAKAEERGLLASEQRRFDLVMREGDELRGLLARFEVETQRRAIPPAHIDLREGRSAARGSELRSMATALLENGGVLAPDAQFNAVWDRLAAEAVLLKAGAQVIQTDRTSLLIPRLTADSVAAWVSESAGSPNPRRRWGAWSPRRPSWRRWCASATNC